MRLIRLLKKDLATEMSTWVDRELISVDQARAICRLYGVDYDEIRSRSTAYRVLVVLGFVFIGLALITVIGANWDAIPRAVRMGGLLALTAGTHAFALRHHLADRTSLATGLFVLGNLFYGASIILIAQIYHLGEHMPDGVFWWALGSLPFAVLLCSPWLTLLSGLLSLLWLYLEYRTGLLNATFLSFVFPAFLAVELYVLARARASALLFLTFVASLILWFQTVLATMWMEGRGRDLGWFDGHRSWSEEHVFVGAALFLVAHAAGHWLHARDGAKARDYGALLSIWTLRFALIGMLVMSFELPWEKLITAEWNHQASMWIVVAALAAAALRLGSKTGTLRPLLLLAALAGGTMVAVVVTGAHADRANLEVHAAVFQVLDNVALVAAGTWLIVRGTATGASHYFFLGVATILLTAFMRYVDLIGDYLGGAVLFLAFAALLLGAARYWKRRQGREVRA